LSAAPVWQAVAIALVGAVVTAANMACLGDLEAGAISRYKVEVAIVRVLKPSSDQVPMDGDLDADADADVDDDDSDSDSDSEIAIENS
jgi:hypothetical protein